MDAQVDLPLSEQQSHLPLHKQQHSSESLDGPAMNQNAAGAGGKRFSYQRKAQGLHSPSERSVMPLPRGDLNSSNSDPVQEGPAFVDLQQHRFPPSTTPQQNFYGYVYVNGVVYPQGSAFGVQETTQNGSAPTDRPGLYSRPASMENLHVMAGGQTPFATPRSSPSGPRHVRAPLMPMQHAQNVHPQQTIAVSPVTPHYNGPNNYNNSSFRGATNTPGGFRRFHDMQGANNAANNYNSGYPQPQFFVAASSNTTTGGLRHSGPSNNLSAGNPVATTVSGFVPRRSNDALSPAYIRRSRARDMSVSGASGVDWEIEGTSMTNLYIKGLKNSCTDEDLHEMCKSFGNIHSSKAILDLTTHECKGFGFVMYETIDEAQHALEELTKLGYNVSFAKETFNTRLKNLQDEDSTNIYVSNLPLDMDEQGMLELFAPHTIVSTKILRDPITQQSRGVGFARMDSRQSANAIIAEFNGKPLDSGQSLQVRFADSAAQKRFKQQGMSNAAVLAQAQRAAGAGAGLQSGSNSIHVGGQFLNPVRGVNANAWSGPDDSSIGFVGSAKTDGRTPNNLSRIGDGVGIEGGASEGNTNHDENTAVMGFMTYYDSGYVPNGMILTPPGPYGFSVTPPQFSPHAPGISAPHVLNGAYYYPAPQPGQATNVAPSPAPQQVIYSSSGHPTSGAIPSVLHPQQPHPYMMPVHPNIYGVSAPAVSPAVIPPPSTTGVATAAPFTNYQGEFREETMQVNLNPTANVAQLQDKPSTQRRASTDSDGAKNMEAVGGGLVAEMKEMTV
ncbi:hypothetical protein HDU84_002729 [Entophlyctis sp. JEL0112]|nr:hypothetical protein HDU84_002729 [Entophlyctis sp. JEL0112]